MSILRLSGFAGENRALHPFLLPDNVGTQSTNQKPGRGDLRPWNEPLNKATVPAGRKTIHRMGRDVVSDTNYWLSWPTDVHVVVAPNAADTLERTYYSGSGKPKWTNTTMALASAPYPTAYRELGVPAPISPCTLTVTVVPFGTPAVPARTETITAPRVVTKIGVRSMFSLALLYSRVYVEFSQPHGMLAGQKPTVVFDDFQSYSMAGTTGIVVIDATKIYWDISTSGEEIGSENTSTHAWELVPATGTATLPSDTVYYPEIPAVGTEAITENRYYTYTYVTDIGEEGAPNPAPTPITCGVSDVVTINSLAAPPAGAYGINRIRIYRTQANSGGGADFYFLREIASTLTTTTDDNRDLGEVLQTTEWLPPPDDLSWLTGLWNGMMAGISGRAIRFCKEYTFYAWPIAYEILPSNAQPVALATFGQNLVVLTNGNPSIITGGTPDAMDEQPIEFYQACVAPLSAVGMGHGVAWASPDGLAYVGNGGARMLTQGVMTQDDWQALKPETIRGCMYEGRYFGFYNDGARKCFILDPANPNGMYFLDFGIDALHVDDLQDALFVLDGVNIQKFDAGSPKTVTFKKLYKMPKPTQGFACAEVVADAYPVTFKLYADGNLKHTQTVTSSSPFRLPGGYYAETFQMEVSGSAAIQGLAVAHSMKELATL